MSFRCTLIFAFLYALAANAYLFAAPRTISGLQFEVTEITPLDDSFTKATVLGRTAVVANDKLDDFIVEESFKNGQNKFNWDQLQRFMLKSLSENNPQRAFLAFQYSAVEILSGESPESQLRLISRFIDQANEFNDLQKLLRDLLQLSELNKLQVEVRDTLYLEALILSPENERKTLLKRLNVRAQELHRTALQMFNIALEKSDVARARRLLGGLQTSGLFEKDSLSDFAAVLTNVEALKGATQGGDYQQNIKLIDNCLKDTAHLSAYKPYLIDLIHYLSAQSLRNEEPAQAIEVLSRLDTTWRTPYTHTLAKNIISNGANEVYDYIGDNKVVALLETIARNDTEFANNYLSVLETTVSKYISRGDLIRAESLISTLRIFRPDPAADNDRLREKLALAWLTLGYRQKSKQIFAECVSPLTWFTRAKVFILRMTDRSLIKYQLLLILILAVLLVIAPKLRANIDRKRFESRKKKLDSAKIQVQMFDSEEDDVTDTASRPPPFKARSSSLERVSKKEEYLKCLQILKLGKAADVAAIKSAYRNLVKTVHPDHQAQSESAHQEFLRLQNAYQRALALRKEFDD